MTDRPAPTCPYCGAEMELEDCGEFYKCSKCLSTSPWMEDCSTAHAAAMQRYEPENRVLTLEELLALPGDAVVYHEWRAGGLQRLFRDEITTKDEPNARKNYGVIARCWLRRPTDAEREGEKWG